MKTLSIQSLHRRYNVYIGHHILSRTGLVMKKAGLSGKVMIVTQKAIAKHYLKTLQRCLSKAGYASFVHFVPQGEKAKSERELFRIYSALLQKQFERRDILLALGGGVVGDLTGYAAASYMRGIAFVNVATTLLAQVDSAIGGKTAINLKEGKNLVGAFYPPHVVMMDVAVLKTLPDREYRASLAEVVKYGVIRDEKLFRFLESRYQAINSRKGSELTTIIERSSRIKGQIVTQDEFETGKQRVILNLGHTFAHGFEQVTKYKGFLHGEAVSVGMVAASQLAVDLRLFKKEDDMRIVNLLKAMLLPIHLKGKELRAPALIAAMRRDKKKSTGRLRFVLPTKIGRVEVLDTVQPNQLRKVLAGLGAG